MVVVDTTSVTVDEANILADFFNLQADKHGPELLKKLHTIGSDEHETNVIEQRNQIKIEVEAENVIKHEVDEGYSDRHTTQQRLVSHNEKPGIALHMSDNNAATSFLVKNESQASQNKHLQYLMSQNGKIISVLPENILKSLPLLQSRQIKNQGFTVHKDVKHKRSVPVIQRAPPKLAQQNGAKFELNNPNIILERRVQQQQGEVGHSIIGPGMTRVTLLPPGLTQINTSVARSDSSLNTNQATLSLGQYK